MTLDLDTVSAAIKELSSAIILPRFRSLAAGDIREKAPGDLVTVVDHEMERALEIRLQAVIPEARVVGEEACASDPSLLTGLDQGWAWPVDPLDGTRNFATGSEDFAVMVGLLKDGAPVAAWIYAPVADRLAVAEAGGGAFIDGVRAEVEARVGPRSPAVIAKYVPEPLRSTLVAAFGVEPDSDGTGAAGLEYPALVEGRWRSLLYWRTLPWDHVPGTLLLEEAGGRVARLDGSPYWPADGKQGLLAAPSMEIWREAHDRLPREVSLTVDLGQ